MKRKSSSSHYWLTTDTGTNYSALNANARHWQKKAKRDEMREYDRLLPRGTAARELLMPPRVEARIQRMKKRQERREQNVDPYFRPTKRPKLSKGTVTSSGTSADFGSASALTSSSGRDLEFMDLVNAGEQAYNEMNADAATGAMYGTWIGTAIDMIPGTAGAGALAEPLGDAIGATYGMIHGAYTSLSHVPLKKTTMVKGSTKAHTMGIDKSKGTKVGKTKITNKNKPVKVSKYLKKAIKQTLVGQQAKGFYQRTFGGLIGTLVNTTTADGLGTSTVMGVNPETSVYYSGRGAGNTSGAKTWFNNACTAGNGSARTAYATLANRDFNFFTPGKILHAASVLFNNKTEIENPYASTNLNLSTMFNNTTGAVVESQSQLKINVLHSKVDWTIKNLSARVLEIDVYECVPTVKFASYGPMVDLLASCTAIQDNTTDDRTISWFADGAVKNGTASNLLVEGTVDIPSLMKSRGWHWDFVKRTIVAAPHEIIKYTMNGPSGVLDFQKLLNPATNQYSLRAVKGWSKCVLFSVRPDPVSTYNTVTASTDFGARWVQTPSTDTGVCLSSQVLVEAEESYRIAVPEIAGFQTLVDAGATASAPQPLNYRKPKIQITNMLTTNPGLAANQTLVVSSEEAPTDSASLSLSL